MNPDHQCRWHPLLDQWVIIAATSNARPWSGVMSTAADDALPDFDPACYLCPGVERAGGQRNPEYRGTHAFDNDFASLAIDAHAHEKFPDKPDSAELLATAQALGKCRVLCWSERHDATIASLSPTELRAVARLWQRETERLATLDMVKQVLLFENRGAEIGASNPHPHGQIYATAFVTDVAKRMCRAQSLYAQESGGSLLQRYLAEPHVQKELLVERNDHASVIVPFAARMPYETWIIPHRHVKSLSDMSDAELFDLASIYQRQMRRYDAFFGRSTPNISLWHNAPVDQHPDNEHWCFHLAMQPPLRSPDKQKFIAGFETGSGNFVNPVQPEAAANALRNAL